MKRCFYHKPLTKLWKKVMPCPFSFLRIKLTAQSSVFQCISMTRTQPLETLMASSGAASASLSLLPGAMMCPGPNLFLCPHFGGKSLLARTPEIIHGKELPFHTNMLHWYLCSWRPLVNILLEWLIQVHSCILRSSTYKLLHNFGWSQ